MLSPLPAGYIKNNLGRYSLCPVQPPIASDDEEMATRAFGSKISWPLTGNTTSQTSTPAAGTTTGTSVSSWNTATSTDDGTCPASQLSGASKSTSGIHILATPSAPTANDLSIFNTNYRTINIVYAQPGPS